MVANGCSCRLASVQREDRFASSPRPVECLGGGGEPSVGSVEYEAGDGGSGDCSVCAQRYFLEDGLVPKHKAELSVVVTAPV
jgi:hypothetical protein